MMTPPCIQVAVNAIKGAIFPKRKRDILNTFPYREICPELPLTLNDATSDDDLIRLSATELATGVIIRGSSGTGSHTFLLHYLSQIMSVGGGLIYFDFFSPVSQLQWVNSFASAMGRERDVVSITRSSMHTCNEDYLKELVEQNKIIYVECGAFEIMDSSVDNRCVIDMINKTNSALHQLRATTCPPFVVAMADGFHTGGRTVYDAVNDMDNTARLYGHGRMFCDWSGIYNKHMKQDFYYSHHLLLAYEAVEYCPFEAERRLLDLGEFLLVKDNILIKDKMHVPSRVVPLNQ